MSQRWIVLLDPGADWNAIKNQLVAHGADWTRDPSPDQPDVLVVTVPEERSTDEFRRNAQEIPGVRNVEPDALRWSL